MRKNSKFDKYQKYFTKEYMMGPNSLKLLDELVSNHPECFQNGRVLDLGCGEALSSIYLGNETKVDMIYATDLWISATDNRKRIQKNGLEERIVPIHADALALPFADEYFDTIVSIDSYHYYGCEEGVFTDKILPLVKKDGYVVLCVPGVNTDPCKETLELMSEWAGDEVFMFHTMEWWENHLKKNCEDRIEILVYESNQFDEVWKDWIQTGHEYAKNDAEFLKRGLHQILCFIMIVIKKKSS